MQMALTGISHTTVLVAGEARASSRRVLQQFQAKHDIAVFPALPALDVNNHAFLSAPQSGRVQSHQKDPVKQCGRRLK
jgi:hypothetical protein